MLRIEKLLEFISRRLGDALAEAGAPFYFLVTEPAAVRHEWSLVFSCLSG